MNASAQNREMQMQKQAEAYLPQWLEIATADLEESAKNKISLEIQNHYADSVAAHTERGLGSLYALGAARNDLGDPTQAASRFKKIYLTTKDAHYLSKIEKQAAASLFSATPFILDLIGTTAFLTFLCFKDLTLHLLCGLSFLIYAGLRLLPRLLFLKFRQTAAFRRGVGLGHNATVLAVFALLLDANFIEPDVLRDHFFSRQAICMAFYAVLINGAARHGKVWHKLKNSNYERNDLSPA